MTTQVGPLSLPLLSLTHHIYGLVGRLIKLYVGESNPIDTASSLESRQQRDKIQRQSNTWDAFDSLVTEFNQARPLQKLPPELFSLPYKQPYQKPSESDDQTSNTRMILRQPNNAKRRRFRDIIPQPTALPSPHSEGSDSIPSLPSLQSEKAPARTRACLHECTVQDPVLERRHRNTQAAQRYRKRKCDELEDTKRKLCILTQEHESLRMRHSRLEGEFQAIKETMASRVSPGCQCAGPRK